MAAAKITSVLNDFHTNFISFLDELIELFPSDAEIIVVRLILKDSVSPETIMTTFIKEVMPHKKAIEDRNEEFFFTTTLFDTFDKGKLNHLKLLWKSSVIDDNDRQVIWKWFDTFIFLTEQYQK